MTAISYSSETDYQTGFLTYDPAFCLAFVGMESPRLKDFIIVVIVVLLIIGLSYIAYQLFNI